MPKHRNEKLLVAIGRRFQRIRREAGWTQEQLAEALDVQTVTLSRWERGERALSLSALARERGDSGGVARGPSGHGAAGTGRTEGPGVRGAEEALEGSGRVTSETWWFAWFERWGGGDGPAGSMGPVRRGDGGVSQKNRRP